METHLIEFYFSKQYILQTVERNSPDSWFKLHSSYHLIAIIYSLLLHIPVYLSSLSLSIPPSLALPIIDLCPLYALSISLPSPLSLSVQPPPIN